MSTLSEKLGPVPDKTPFKKGQEAAETGKPAPSFPGPDSDWSERLYHRGFMSVN